MDSHTKFYVKIGCLGLICVMLLSAMIALVAINASKGHGHTGEGLTSDSGAALSPEARAKWLAYTGDESASYGRVYDTSLLNLSDNKTLQVMAEQEGMQDFKNLDRTDTGGSNYTDGEGMGAGDDDTSDDDKAPTANDNSDDDANTREVEEADIVKAVGSTEYVLNPYKGLMIVDLSSPDSPVVEGKAKVLGDPVEMYVVDFLAFIIVNKDYDYYFSYWMYGDGAKMEPDYIGTELVVVNCLDKENPKVVKTFDIEGFASNSRRVGEVIYVVTNTYSWYGYYGYMDPSDMTYVTSISLTDPAKVGMVEQIAFSGSTNQIYASPTALFVAQTEYIYNYWWGDDDVAIAENSKSSEASPEDKWANDMYRTNLTYVDIHDPDGDIGIMDNVTIPGEVTSRFQMDHYEGYFRVVTHHQVSWSGLGSSTLWIYDVSEPSRMELTGSLDIDDAGVLMATRFAGDRAYTIHLPHSVDPLDIIDLSNPSKPKLCDMVEMPGWVTFMEVRGYDIIALGVDDSTGDRKVALSLFDVSNPDDAVLLDRVSIGEGPSYSGANWDDKQLSIIDEDSMVLIPYEAESNDNGEYSWGYGVQIVTFDLQSGDLALRGSAKTPDMVVRTRVVSDRIVATSSERLTVIDARSLDSPAVSAEMELAPNVVDSFEFGDHSINMVQGNYDNSITFYVAPGSNPDTFTPLSRLETGADYGKAFANEQYI